MSLNIEAQKLLDKILVKSIPELLSEDIAFLRARKSYLSIEQSKFYKSILSDKVSKKMIKEEVGESKLSYKELQREASNLGMKNVVGKSKKNLIEFLKDNIY